MTAQINPVPLQTFFQTAPLALKVLDKKGVLLRINRALQTFLGYEEKEMIGRTIFEFMHPDEVAYAKHLFYTLINNAEVPPDGIEKLDFDDFVLTDRRYQKKDGSVVWVNLFLFPIFEPDGSLSNIVGLMNDITKRKDVLANLKKREVQERAILDTVVDGILTIDDHSRIETFNRACEKSFGWSAYDVIGKDVGILIPDEERETFDDYLQLTHDSMARRAIKARREDGSLFPVELGVGPMHIDHQKKFTVVLRDVSERERFLQRLRGSERMEAVGQLAGGIAHDFNNLLTIINMHAYLLQSDGLSPDGPGPSYLQKILDATERGARLTAQLQSLSPASIATREPVLLNDVVSSLSKLFTSVIEEDIEVRIDLADDLQRIDADLSQIEQILLNLIINARDAMPQGGTIDIKTCNQTIIDSRPPPDSRHLPEHPPDLSPGDYVMVLVTDTGTGIPERVRKYIFDPYFTTKEPGTGLGLATVYSIVERHNGAIDVRTTLGKGSTFTVYLPVTQNTKTASLLCSTSLPDADAVHGKTVLLVEDETDIRSSLRKALEQDGFEVLAAESGEHALEIAHHYYPGTIDLVLTDLIMGGINGMELADELRELYPRIRSIFVSGYSGEVLKRKEISPHQVHMSKPYDIDVLKNTLRDLLH